MRTILLFFWLERWQCSKAKDRYSSAAESTTDTVSTVPALCLELHPPLHEGPKVSEATMSTININRLFSIGSAIFQKYPEEHSVKIQRRSKAMPSETSTEYTADLNEAGLLCTGALHVGVFNRKHYDIAPSVAADHKCRVTKDTGPTMSQLWISPLAVQLFQHFIF